MQFREQLFVSDQFIRVKKNVQKNVDFMQMLHTIYCTIIPFIENTF